MNDTGTMKGESQHSPGSTNGISNNMATTDLTDNLSGTDEIPSSILVTPDMLYKLSKKIAQLTKVIYSLNTKNDDLEMDLEQLRASYEEKLQLAQQQLHMATANLQQQYQDSPTEQGDLANGLSSSEVGSLPRKRRSKTPEIDRDSETRKELKKTKQALKQTEAKVKAMEEEIQEKKVEMDRLHKEAAARQTTPTPIVDNAKTVQLEQRLVLLEQQLKQASKDKLELTMRLDRSDIQRENLRLERDMLKKDINEISKEKDGLQLQLSATRIQLNYNREMGYANGASSVDKVDAPKPVEDDFADELIAKIEKLTQEKSDLSKELEESQVTHQKLRKELELTSNKSQQEQSPDLHKHCEAAKMQLNHKISSLESSLKDMSDSHEQQLAAIRGDKDKALDESSKKHYMEKEELITEVEQIKIQIERERALHQEEKAEVERSAGERVKALETNLAIVQRNLEEVSVQSDEKSRSLATRLEEIALEREQESENSRALILQLEEISQRELIFKQEMGQNVEKLCSLEEKCRSIEKERDDLKRKCKELEAKLDVMTRTVVKDTDEKVRQLERALEEALVEREEILEACEKEIQHEKTIAIETEQKMMDDFEWKLREIEAEYRGKIREVEEKSKADKDEYAQKKDGDLMRMGIAMQREMEDKLRLERTSLKDALNAQHITDRETAIERVRMESQREIRVLQVSWEEEKNRLEREIRSLKRKIEDLEKDAQTRRAEIERRVQEERQKNEVVVARVRQEIEYFKQESEVRMEQLRQENAEKIAEYEMKLTNANDNRMSSMFQMREEVETEFTERMEALRNMYMTEIESQVLKMEEEKSKSNRTEISLRQIMAEKQQEIEELNSYYSQQGEEYETKINDLLTRLQEQTTLAMKLQAEIDSYEWYEEDEEEEKASTTPTSRKPISRPSSTRPLEQHRIPEEVHQEEPSQLHRDSPHLRRDSPQLRRELTHYESPELRHTNSSAVSLASTASYATPTGLNEGGAAAYLPTPDSQSYASNSSSPSQPEPPPRRDVGSNRRSWNQDGDSPQAHHTVSLNPDPIPTVADRLTGEGSIHDPTDEPNGTGFSKIPTPDPEIQTTPVQPEPLIKPDVEHDASLPCNNNSIDNCYQNQTDNNLENSGDQIAINTNTNEEMNSSEISADLGINSSQKEGETKPWENFKNDDDNNVSEWKDSGSSTPNKPLSFEDAFVVANDSEMTLEGPKQDPEQTDIELCPSKVETSPASLVNPKQSLTKPESFFPTKNDFRECSRNPDEIMNDAHDEEFNQHEDFQPCDSKAASEPGKMLSPHDEPFILVEDDSASNPTMLEATDDVSDEIKLIPSAKSPSRSSLGTFFHQKLFHSHSTSSASALTNSSSSQSSPETKKRSSVSSTSSSSNPTNKKSQCTHQ